METFIIRFPTVTQSILQELDNQSLTRCREVCLNFHKFLNQDKVLWMKRIQNFSENYGNHQKSWNLVMKQIAVDILKKLALCVESFFKQAPFGLPKFSISPLHVAVHSGNFEICKYVVDKTSTSNSENSNEVTPLHIAARNGYLDIYKFVSESVQDKNPECTTTFEYMVFTKLTPLHLAAKYGHLDIYKFIHENICDKNPIGNMMWHGSEIPTLTTIGEAAKNNQIGILRFILDDLANNNTPISHIISIASLLNILALKGLFEAFKLIFENTGKQNHAMADDGVTPLHSAAKMGRFDIYKLIFDHLEDKDPRDNNGKSSLHAAVQDLSLFHNENHMKIFKYNFENGIDVNPPDDEGNTVLHYIAKGWSKSRLKELLYDTEFEEKAKEIVKFIRNSIGDKCPENNSGMTPSDYVSDPEISKVFTEK